MFEYPGYQRFFLACDVGELCAAEDTSVERRSYVLIGSFQHQLLFSEVSLITYLYRHICQSKYLFRGILDQIQERSSTSSLSTRANLPSRVLNAPAWTQDPLHEYPTWPRTFDGGSLLQVCSIFTRFGFLNLVV